MQEQKNNDEGQAEARRILDRINRESDPDHGMVARGFERAKNHLSAADADQADAIEVWGTRIGRVLGLVLVAAAILWLLSYLGKPT
ncbi:hypothetical protein C7477_10935 [Phyllobacterium leguminum]|uniref:Uncharacterized protein n=2 Tax=Phyllobacterium leguminum TaxID=314237 RepID=A0A318T4T2_9HYPH|nr:hypothetical protein C7477_10935 [Phyllobacterium leguminum]